MMLLTSPDAGTVITVAYRHCHATRRAEVCEVGDSEALTGPMSNGRSSRLRRMTPFSDIARDAEFILGINALPITLRMLYVSTP